MSTGSKTHFNIKSMDENKFLRMAEHFFGHGRWRAPYWFIGPEQGMAKTDTLEIRYQAWEKLGCKPLIDCKEFHHEFGFYKWHKDNPPTQPTWRQLIRLLLAFEGKPSDNDEIRKYQRDKWGRFDGETCVIELSGLAAPSLATLLDRERFLVPRIEHIKANIVKYQPKFVVMYGKQQEQQWIEIAGNEFDGSGFCRKDNTLYAFTVHPVSRGIKNEYWEKLGEVMCGQ